MIRGIELARGFHGGRFSIALAMVASKRQAFYEERAPQRPREAARYYHRLLERSYSFFVEPGDRVLELGSELGDLLAAVRPSRGVGVDFSPTAVELARERHPELEFHLADVVEFETEEQFDYILVSDLVNDLPDIQAVLERAHRWARPRTRLVLNFFNYVWRPILAGAEAAHLKSRTPPQSWLSATDMKNLLYLSGWELIQMDTRILWPLRTPGWEQLLNRWLAPIFWRFCLTIFQVARPKATVATDRQYRCSVVIPARNEAGTIETAVARVPDMGLGTEIIFVEGHSQDGTWKMIETVAAKYPGRAIKCLKQQGTGKGSAVREGFEAASGDLLFILDADLTVAPEQLPKFYEVARSGVAEFVNGVRLVYPMEQEAMRFWNLVANKFFGAAFSWLLGQPVKDTLCGTKVLFRADYQRIAANRAYFGDFDPFGDFDLLFGAAKLNLRILDLPIRYQARTYGQTNIQRWREGRLLLRMVLFAAARLKFLP